VVLFVQVCLGAVDQQEALHELRLVALVDAAVLVMFTEPLPFGVMLMPTLVSVPATVNTEGLPAALPVACK
jgi:hypothetical protein